MVYKSINFPPVSPLSSEGKSEAVYWSLLQGEFPWCLDDSEETETPSDLMGSFDLIWADTFTLKPTGRNAKPDTSWLPYAELCLAEHGSLLIAGTTATLRFYVQALAEAGLDYNNTYLWNSQIPTNSQSNQTHTEAILWASKGQPQFRLSASDNAEIIVPASCPYVPSANRSAEDALVEEKQNLLEFLISSLTQSGANVLEPFMNNSQVVVACKKLMRFCLSISRKRSVLKQAEHVLLGSLKRTA